MVEGESIRLVKRKRFFWHQADLKDIVSFTKCCLDMYNLKAIIVGAGIGGLTTAIAMQQAGYEVEIYEKSQCAASGRGGNFTVVKWRQSAQSVGLGRASSGHWRHDESDGVSQPSRRTAEPH